MAKHTETVYGFFCGGDPRNFHPDYQDCTPTEVENHKRARALWDEAEARGETPTPEACPSGWITPDVHVLCAPYGIGVQVFEFVDEEADNA